MTARPPRLLGSLRCAAAVACMLTLCAVPALAQSARGSSTPPPTPFQGLQQNNKEPIRIESASLEVRDKERIATFIDNVKVVQGDTTLECHRLIVYYDDEPSPGAAKGRQPTKSLLPSEGGQQQIHRLEAKGGVVVTQKDQVATGDNGVYEMKTNSIVLTGNVVVTRGQDVVKGHRLHVNMTTGHYRIDSAPAGGQSGQVRALINPGAREAPVISPAAPNAKPGAPAAAPAASPLPPPPATGGRAPAAATERTSGAAERDAAKQGPSRPPKLN